MARLPENTSGSFVFQRYGIRTFTRPGKTSARAFVGDKPTQVVADAKTVDEAVRSVERQLAERDAIRRAGRRDGIPMAAEYADAFAALGPKIKVTHWKMLTAHLEAPGSTLTTREIAQAVGYASHTSASNHYGALGRLVAEWLGFDPPRRPDGSEMWTACLAIDGHQEGEPESEWRWTMRPEVVECLHAFTVANAAAATRTATT